MGNDSEAVIFEGSEAVRSALIKAPGHRDAGKPQIPTLRRPGSTLWSPALRTPTAAALYGWPPAKRGR